MNGFTQFIDIILHLNKYLDHFAGIYGVWIYAILFVIIFSETGLVVTPFLPGDALLFTVGTLTAGDGSLNLPVILVLLTAAAILGNLVNYSIGRTIGQQSKQPHLQTKTPGTDAPVLRKIWSQSDPTVQISTAAPNDGTFRCRDGVDGSEEIHLV
jgi:membrane-associated protein